MKYKVKTEKKKNRTSVGQNGLACGRWKQENQEFRVSLCYKTNLDYTMRFCQKKKKVFKAKQMKSGSDDTYL